MFELNKLFTFCMLKDMISDWNIIFHFILPLIPEYIWVKYIIKMSTIWKKENAQILFAINKQIQILSELRNLLYWS
jgi:hypothetical protein